MNQTDRHTPGELSFDIYGNIITEKGKTFLFRGVSTPMTAGPASDEARANVSRFVTIWNSHADLVAALGQLLNVAEDAINRLYDNQLSEYPAGNITEILDASAALSRARGEEVGK